MHILGLFWYVNGAPLVSLVWFVDFQFPKVKNENEKKNKDKWKCSPDWLLWWKCETCKIQYTKANENSTNSPRTREKKMQQKTNSEMKIANSSCIDCTLINKHDEYEIACKKDRHFGFGLCSFKITHSIPSWNHLKIGFLQREKEREREYKCVYLSNTSIQNKTIQLTIIVGINNEITNSVVFVFVYFVSSCAC